MKYPCNLVKDLLPLYHDGVCSEESTEVVEQHLAECKECEQYYSSLCRSDDMVVIPDDPEWEKKKASSYQRIRKKLLKKQIGIICIVIVVLSAMLLSAVKVLKNIEQVIVYDENITVAMTDQSLIGRLQGNRADHLRVKRVETGQEENKKVYLFFSMSGTKWDDIVTNENVFSEYVLCSADKGSEQIDSVFYYTGDYANIESMSAQELEKIMKKSVLLWEK